MADWEEIREVPLGSDDAGEVLRESAADIAAWVGAGAGVVSAGGVPAAIYYARRQLHQAAESAELMAAKREAEMRALRAEMDAELRVQRAEMEAEMRILRTLGYGFGPDDEYDY